MFITFLLIICLRTADGLEVEVTAKDLERIRELGRGAYGVVEEMRHTATGQIFAVKVVFCLIFQARHVFSEFILPLMMKVGRELLSNLMHASKAAAVHKWYGFMVQCIEKVMSGFVWKSWIRPLINFTGCVLMRN